MVKTLNSSFLEWKEYGVNYTHRKQSAIDESQKSS